MSTYDQVLARALMQAVAQVQELPDSPDARVRTVAALQAAMKNTAAPASPRPAWVLALAAALTLVVGAGLWFRAQPHGVAWVVASSGTLEVGHALANAEVVNTGQATMVLGLRRGVKLSLQPETSVQLFDEGARVVVRRGEVAAEMTSLEAPFFLEAGDAVVATRGARVKVKPGAGCDGRAGVTVAEGSVLINGSTRVQAGESWPTCVPAAALPQPAQQTPPQAVVESVRLVPTKRTAPPAPPSVKDDDRLARQNELYQAAITLQRSGDVSGAVKKLEAVLADPRSPLAETALAQKMRWLAATNREAARGVAREYLERFPMGFGRADAETLVLEPR